MKIRLRDIPLKCNFPNAFSDRKCLAAPLCQEEDTNEHLFKCFYMTSKTEICKENIRYEQIFSDNVSDQEIIANIIFTRLEQRKTFLNP